MPRHALWSPSTGQVHAQGKLLKAERGDDTMLLVYSWFADQDCLTSSHVHLSTQWPQFHRGDGAHAFALSCILEHAQVIPC